MHVALLKKNRPEPVEVSVLMTVFNTERYLEQAVRSVLAQSTRRTWELILVDDGSTDGSLALARHFASLHPACIRLLQHLGGVNRGISASRNLALQQARGANIAFLDSDDVWLPHHLETLSGILEQEPEVAGVFAGAERWVNFREPFDEERARAAWWGENYLPPLLPAGEPFGIVAPGELVRWFLEDESLVPCICSVLVRASAARLVGGFVNEFRGLYDDQAFHAKLSLRFSLYAERQCVARYRKHAASCCAVGAINHALQAAERRRFLLFLDTYRRAISHALEPSCV